MGQRKSDTTDKAIIELVNYVKVKKIVEPKAKTEEKKPEVVKNTIEKVKEVKVKKTAGVKKVIAVKKSGER